MTPYACERCRATVQVPGDVLSLEALNRLWSEGWLVDPASGAVRFLCPACRPAMPPRIPDDVVLVDAVGHWVVLAIPPMHQLHPVQVHHHDQRLLFTRSGELDIQGRQVFRCEGAWAPTAPSTWSQPPPPLVSIESALTDRVLDGLDLKADNARGLILVIQERVAGEVGFREVQTPELTRALVSEVRRLRALVRALKGYPEPREQDEAAPEPVDFDDLLQRHA